MIGETSGLLQLIKAEFFSEFFRNSTINSQDEYKLPTYDEFKSKKMLKTFN